MGFIWFFAGGFTGCWCQFRVNFMKIGQSVLMWQALEAQVIEKSGNQVWGLGLWAQKFIANSFRKLINGQYLVKSPLKAITAATRRLQLWIKCRIYACGMSSQIRLISARNSAMFRMMLLGRFNCCFIWSHKCSIGLRSGLLLGQSITSMASRWSKVLVTLAVCGGAPSCMKIGRSWRTCASKWGTTCASSTSLQYLLALRFPLISWRGSLHCRDMQPHTITEPPWNACRRRTHGAPWRSPSALHTWMRPSLAWR